MSGAKKDFFVSYNSADRDHAIWIAAELEEAGYTIVIQEWDFRPGGNFVIEMQRASVEADRTIPVLSPDYLGASFTQPEWAAAFATDPQGLNRHLIPVMVRKCSVEGILGPIIQIRLYGLKENEARERLLAGVKSGRAKPSSKPPFPVK